VASVKQRSGCPASRSDVDAEKVAALNRGECYIRHVDAARVKRARATTLFAGIPVAVGRRSALA
jgi:UDP-N-acetyl-D-mannosaminuronate dehydrogenase